MYFFDAQWKIIAEPGRITWDKAHEKQQQTMLVSGTC